MERLVRAEVTKIQWRAHPRYRASLKTLTEIEWDVELGVWSTPRTLYHLVQRDPIVQVLRERYQKGMLTDAQIEAFVEETSKDIKTGYSFEHQTAWAALLWIMQGSESDFAQEFTGVLAKNKSAELMHVARVAREVRG